MGAPPLVGRRDELAWIEQRLDDSLAGRPQVVLVSGDPGIGKSRLVREVQRSAVGRGAEVCAGRCREQLDLPYLPFVGSLLPRLEQLANTHPDLRDDGRVIRRLLGRDADDAPPAVPTDVSPEQQQAWLFVAVARLTLRLAQERPLVVAVDDLHWADRPSLDLLGHLAIELADTAVRQPAPVLVVATHRPAPGGAAAAELARLRREEICSRLELGGLSEPEASDLVRSLGLERASRQLVTTVHRATRGNPLFIESVVHRLSRSAGVQEKGGDLVAGAGAPAVPEELGDEISARVTEVSDAAREVLTLASFLGDTVRFRDLEAVTGAGDVELQDLLDEGVDQGVLAWDGPELRFAHPLFAEALHAGTAPSRRRRIHLTIADALDGAGDAGEAGGVLELAHHLIEAGPLTEPHRLLEPARQAGEAAWAVLAWGEAARYFAAAAAAAEQVGAADDVLGDLHHRAGVAHYRNMDRGPTRHHLERATESYRATADRDALARTLADLVRLEITSGSFGVAVDLAPLDDALEGLEETKPGTVALILAQMAEALWVSGRIGEGAERARRALELGRAAGDGGACARALVALATTHWFPLELDEARRCLEEARRLARDEHDPWLEGIPLARLALTLLWLGRLDDATEAGRAAMVVTDTTGDWAERSLAVAALVGIAVARGDFRAAESLAEEAWMASRLARYEWACLLSLPAIASARLHQGRFEPAEAAVDRLLGLHPEGDNPYAPAADIMRRFVRAHAAHAAGAEVDGADEPLAADWPWGLGTTAWFAALAEIADTTGTAAPLERIDAALEHAAGRGMVVTDGMSFLVPRVRGLVARMRGDDRAAELHLRGAIHVGERLGMRPELGWASLELARVLRRSGGGTPDEPARLAARAREVFRELQRPAFEEEARLLAVGEPGDGDAGIEGPDGMAVILFTDVAGSTALTEEIGDRAYRVRAAALDVTLREAVDECGGEAIEGITLGDGVMAVFGSARRAIECASQAHARARSNAFRLHVGIHAGDILRSRTGVHGGAVNIAARVCDQAPPGETLVSDTIRSLARTSTSVTFEDRGVHQLKGVGEPMRLFAVTTRRAAEN